MRAVILINGIIEDYAMAGSRLRDDDLIIAADGGAHHALRLERRPDVVVGDMDSIDPKLLARLENEGVAVERHPPEKDKTDLELAVERAIHERADEVLLLGALGGRLDQTLANLLMLAANSWPLPVWVAAGRQCARILRGSETLTLSAEPGALVSVVPLSERVDGVTYTGLRYGLENATLLLGSTRGVSNVLESQPATISIRDGLLIVIEESLES